MSGDEQPQDFPRGDFKRGFLNFLEPQRPASESIFCLDDFQDMPERDPIPLGAMEFAGIPFDYSAPWIKIDVALTKIDAAYYSLEKWADSLVKIIAQALCLCFIEEDRQWDGFIVNIHRYDGNIVIHRVSHERFLHFFELQDKSTEHEEMKVQYSIDGLPHNEEILLFDWLDGKQGQRLMGPMEIRTTQDHIESVRRSAINHQRESAVFTAVALGLAEDGFFSLRQCETKTCDAFAWPIIRVKRGQAPLALRFCPACEERYRRERNTQKQQNYRRRHAK